MTVPRGHMAVFSVDTDEEARRLLTVACETNYRGEHIAAELIEEQTADNLIAFGERLARAYADHADYIRAGPRS